MLRVGMPGALAWAICACGKTHRHFLNGSHVVAGSALEVIMIAGRTSAQAIRKSKEQDLLLTDAGRHTAGQRATWPVERGEEGGPAGLPLLESGMGCLVFGGFTVYWRI